ncbi:C-GCAxxG-C-C family protein [Clostridium sp. CM028]|uniref:C-GCAxxG-C-C family (seleno)protein n=1 Tax=unclassified Clostridium TaxID=2614128 RepID=UPI001C6E123C|nr:MULTISPECIES: C-GCAxxG-C-C family (seleno)protein [unclassified Clostridium]MBW9147030.1 C-GCAxxG-C-C family protein [Clostridium sp. CM027]MBW9150135.1 C-GCAxxG-C-C family protein [Clostridium sp. CM028]UVE39675.1 C-GCAxxG-C-C family protein [Clostridium sp. CM027]WLC60380.1 C-GCAxxG-C-C family protein [Clostridium sp. CM028]
MLIDKINKYYTKEYDLSCAEVMIYAASDEYNMKLKSETFKTMSSFGGGMGIESVCGAITGSLAVIGILFTKEKAHEGDRVKRLCQEFFQKFESKLSTNNCAALKAKYKKEDGSCKVMIETATEILDEIVIRELKVNNLTQ